MKKILLLAALIVAPAWAGDIKVMPTASQVVMHDTPAPSGIVIELKGDAKDVAALVADLEKEAIFKEAACTVRESQESTKISCARADGKQMEYLDAYPSAKVHWSISGATTLKA
ncbi:MAG: hypothetical protein V1879_00430, partial [Pseudomonadota bacterium]